MSAELKEEEEELKRNERERCLDSQLLEISTRMLTFVKNMAFYRKFGRNRLIVSIDGYDETSTMDRFKKYRGRRIWINGSNLPRGLAL